MTPPRPFNPGTALVGPKLYRFDGEALSWEITVLRPWPDPRAWRRTIAGGIWRGCRPDIDLAIADKKPRRRASRRRRLEHEAFGRVPQELRRLIGPHHAALQWGLLSLCARVPGADQLLASVPALGVGLAWSFRLREPVRQPLRSARGLVRRPRRAIAGWLGFPPTRAAVRVLSRLQPADCGLSVLRHLAGLLHDDERWLYHLPALPADVLLLIDAPTRPWLTFGLLRELAEEPKRSRRVTASWQVREALALADRVKGVRLPPLRSIAQVDELVQELTELEQRRHLERWKAAGPFPEPPYPAQQMPRVFSDDRPVHLAPIGDAESLIEHAARQRNCLGGEDHYLERILDGSGYAYELTWQGSGDERATLFVEGRGLLHRHWGVDDLRLRFNDEPPEWLDGQVARFLSRVPAQRNPASSRGEPVPHVDRRQLELPLGLADLF